MIDIRNDVTLVNNPVGAGRVRKTVVKVQKYLILKALLVKMYY